MNRPTSDPTRSTLEPNASGTAPDVPRKVPLPGMAVISIWMLAQSAIGAFGVLHHVFRPEVLILSVVFAAAAVGLLRQQRWGWALALAAAFLSMCWGSYAMFRLHQGQWVVMAVVNLVFFLYLVRPEVLQRLK